ncbi:hypothetical protein O7626_19415 [Micromonospora sp. WMMD1102]|uniref:hypothetical protein n=1 Tax=Micromonospora sp. WMMD1102 TaxID=3016105 RepID=UPI0024157AD6|nr:hypothetical protein [Micromonospora sp. WMMD1102]MDG4788083.1 hypothetical protein [Micromonospora sp. WMMD1102]
MPKRREVKTCERCGAGYMGRHTRASCDWYLSIPPDGVEPAPTKPAPKTEE